MIGVVGFALLCGFALVCCTQPTTPGVDSRSPRTDEAETREAELPARPQNTTSAQPGETRPRDQVGEWGPPQIDMDTPETSEPRTPRYLAIVEQIQADQDAAIRATIHPPTKLELETNNIKRLRITREGLPLAQNRSIVLRIDGQGIEWTQQYIAVELERSSAGIWTVVGRRPYAEP